MPGRWHTRGVRRADERDQDLAATSTALTAQLQGCELSSNSSPSWMRFPPPPDLRQTIDWAREERLERQLAADEPVSCDKTGPETSRTAPPDVPQFPQQPRPRLLTQGTTTWHPSTGHRTWTNSALRHLRCAGTQRKKRARNSRASTDATTRLQVSLSAKTAQWMILGHECSKRKRWSSASGQPPAEEAV